MHTCKERKGEGLEGEGFDGEELEGKGEGGHIQHINKAEEIN